MKNLDVLTYEQVSPEAKEIFDAIKKKAGKVPNIYATIANSPVALKAFLQYGEALQSGQFNPKEVEAIALVIAQLDDCGYCLAAHTAMAKIAGFSEEETLKLRTASIEDVLNVRQRGVFGLSGKTTMSLRPTGTTLRR